MHVIQTDPEQIGQIYVPVANWLLMMATVALVLSFQSSNNLASAYGLAVSSEMLITTTLAFVVALRRGWPRAAAAALCAIFLIVDVTFLGANLVKFVDGGWCTLVIAVIVFTVIEIWRSGMQGLRAVTRENREPTEKLLMRLAKDPPARIPGTAGFMTSNTSETRVLLVHHLERNRVLHERVILVTDGDRR